mmetsp:Transcript_8039/g.10219  ORF Transcript_8039/g.10219 Transcript_8039/m.10219 type:complete len:154 (-) Transcript_8039:462-923(-)
MTAHVPPLKWAQRKDSVFLTIDLPDIVKEKIDLTASGLSFFGESEEQKYEFSVEFFAKVIPEESVWKVHGRNVLMHLVKVEKEEEYWPRLTTEKKFDKQYVTTDWSRYVDEDDENVDTGFDLSGLAGGEQFGGDMNDFGAGDEEEPDSDDDGT